MNSFVEIKSMASFELRSRVQYSFLVSLSVIEKARYLAEAAQQLSYDVLLKLMPVFERNLDILKSICLGDFECDYFYMDLQFCLKVCIFSYERLINVVRCSNDMYENFCSKNSTDVLPRLCFILDSLWRRYWKTFHINEDKLPFLTSIQEELVTLYSHITIKGNEKFPNSYTCLSCEKDTGYLKTGRSNVCDRTNTDNKKTDEDVSSMDYCHHFIDICDNSKYFNINRTIFERRMNEIGTEQN